METRNWVIHQRSHAEWTKDIERACDLDTAVTNNVIRYHSFLSEYTGKFIVTHDIGEVEYPVYRVIWTDDHPHAQAFSHYVYKDEVWFKDRIILGELDDCEICAGTGVSFYSESEQCWGCGESGAPGKGSGKCKENVGEE